MKTRLLCFILVLSAAAMRAQQPDVRVQLFSLYRVQAVHVMGGKNTQVNWGSQQKRLPEGAELLISARDNVLLAENRTVQEIRITGDFVLGGDRTRRQSVQVPVTISARTGELRIVGHFPMEEYVAAVLQGETSGRMPPEALKAMAVAIRSYATHFRERHKDKGLDFCDTTHCQYIRTEIATEVRAAVGQTRGESIWERGVPLPAYYHKDCGGQTESAAVVWPDQKFQALASHADPYCSRSAGSWRSEISRTDLDRASRNAGVRLPRDWSRVAIVEKTPSGRARTLRFISGGGQWAPVSASSFRFAVGRTLGWNRLKSDWYEISNRGDLYVFSGRGVGHGVGLCQTGAAEMARQGKSYRDILGFYYPGAPVGLSASGIPWQVTAGPQFDVRTVNSSDLRPVQSAGESALEWAQRETGLRIDRHPVLDVYPTVSMFRDATGEPGWVAASTRGYRIRIEPPAVLGARLESVLRHEFLHLLIEAHARPDTPLWFREGLVLHLSGEQLPPSPRRLPADEVDEAIQRRRSEREVKEAYASAASIVAELNRQFGRRKLMEWLRNGVPRHVLILHGSGRTQKVPHQPGHDQPSRDNR